MRNLHAFLIVFITITLLPLLIFALTETESLEVINQIARENERLVKAVTGLESECFDEQGLYELEITDKVRKNIYSLLGSSDFSTRIVCRTIRFYPELQQLGLLPHLQRIGEYILNSDWSNRDEETSEYLKPYGENLAYTGEDVTELVLEVSYTIYSMDKEMGKELMKRFIKNFPSRECISVMGQGAQMGDTRFIEPILRSAVYIQRPCEEQAHLPRYEQHPNCWNPDWMSAWDWSSHIANLWGNSKLPSKKDLTNWIKIGDDDIEREIRFRELYMALGIHWQNCRDQATIRSSIQLREWLDDEWGYLRD